ncbi:hypothetical protein, partial [Thioalkalivibrio sp.]|uniref:hypothetical protein n=1 Tax=Thioalkalivibrio sp. TaxID=2093813 RepID=UPI003974AA74
RRQTRLFLRQFAAQLLHDRSPCCGHCLVQGDSQEDTKIRRMIGLKDKSQSQRRSPAPMPEPSRDSHQKSSNLPIFL